MRTTIQVLGSKTSGCSKSLTYSNLSQISIEFQSYREMTDFELAMVASGRLSVAHADRVDSRRVIGHMKITKRILDYITQSIPTS